MESDFLRFFFDKKVTFWDFSPWVSFCILCRAWHFEIFFWHKSDFLRFFHWGSCSKCTANRYHLTSTVTFWDFSWHKSDFLRFFSWINYTIEFVLYIFLFVFPFHQMLHSENSGLVHVVHTERIFWTLILVVSTCIFSKCHSCSHST